jgi:hypothetical protein
MMPGEYLRRFALLLWEYARNHDQRMEADGPASGRDCHEGAPGGRKALARTLQPFTRLNEAALVGPHYQLRYPPFLVACGAVTA